MPTPVIVAVVATCAVAWCIFAVGTVRMLLLLGPLVFNPLSPRYWRTLWGKENAFNRRLVFGAFGLGAAAAFIPASVALLLQWMSSHNP